MKLRLFLVLVTCAGWLLPEPVQASNRTTALDLSVLPWTVSIEGRSGPITTAPFDEALDALVKEFGYADVAVFEVEVPITEAHLTTPHAFILGPIHTASEVYFDGQLVGKSGNITHRNRDYLDLGPGRQTLTMVLPDELESPGRYLLRIRSQAKVYRPGPVRGPRVLLPVQEAISIAQRNSRIHYISETMWFTATLLVMAFVFFRTGFRYESQNRDRWLPLLLIAVFGSLGPQTFLFNDLGFLSPISVRLGHTFPVQLLLLLHMYAALGLERPTWQSVIIFGLNLGQISVAWWDGPVELALAKDMLVTIGATTLVLFLMEAAWRAYRMDHRISVWTYIYIVHLICFILLFAVLPPVTDLLVDPASLMVLLGSGILALGAIDHARWDREAVTTLSQALLHSGEQERGRLARELHDGLSHRMALIRMRLESAGRTSGEAPDVTNETIEELRASSDELTAIVEGLRPLSLTGGDLHVALEAFADRWSRMSDIVVQTKIATHLLPDEETQLHLLRIAQEAVQNAVRHGKASHVSIGLADSGGHIVLTIEDNGTGFQLQTITVGKGIGLTAMRQRVELLKGILDIDSGPGRGTKIWVEVPVP